VHRTALAAFEHVGQEALTLAPLMRAGLDEVRRRVEVCEGREALEAALAEGGGAVLVSGHFGNWEFAGSVVAAFGFPIEAVMQRLKNHRLSGYVEEMRRRLGMGLIDRVGAFGRSLECLADGRVVAFVADQDARSRGVFVPFFGRLASTHGAPAALALRANAPFFVGGAYRIGPRRYHFWLVRLWPREGVGVREQALDLTRQWVSELERRVRLFPEQYFWHHRRWKTPPPGTGERAPGIKLDTND
jgi:KDO2-lipid IV(A) lauroyltransferase